MSEGVLPGGLQNSWLLLSKKSNRTFFAQICCGHKLSSAVATTEPSRMQREETDGILAQLSGNSHMWLMIKTDSSKARPWRTTEPLSEVGLS